MALFGLFGKKGNPPAPPDPSDARTQNRGSGSVQRRARGERSFDTEKKIDAIESEMSSEFVPSRTLTGANTIAPGETGAGEAELAPSTDVLLGVEGKAVPAELGLTEAAPALQEAAILFADEQYELAEQMLRIAIDADPENDREAWLMLLDLYQATGRQDDFDRLSIDYATRFETSPPSWRETETAAPPARSATPSVALSGMLDSSIIKSLERLQKLAEQNTSLRLDFARITGVAPVGCGLLLRSLKRLHEHELALSGTEELAARIRAILEVGRRDETEAPWLLLMELLRLQNRQQEFEDTSIDYCITFEVSPPPFVPPKTAATRLATEAQPAGDAFLLPPVIEGRNEILLADITRHAALHDPLVLDCSRLVRIDFTAAGQLLMSLSPLARAGAAIEFTGVSRLVLALFAMIGITEIARISPRKS
ncbi:STAS domain-containing protein [Noviherbaspirillum pedocola]|uniref:STAS domain-containing protein n=1 Tax=Noviherbaspirillum pedocola TaxID=2801341 RepID=A0A934SVC6_9BURK|nr:STAS domain-containing protein [Noviherbaspirillum pedocola]MBK4736432.1 STAS domain-containing protein [Noviherbaspirillum pedocola]